MIKTIQIVWFFVGMVIVVAGASFAAFKWSDGITDGQEEIMETVEHINVEQAFFAEDLAEVMDTVHGLDRKFETLQDHQVKQGKAMKRLVWMIEHKEQFTPEQWKIIMDEYLKKNSELGSMQKIEIGSSWTLSEINTDLIRER
jgi:predicted nuclease with TOPRIM domain